MKKIWKNYLNSGIKPDTSNKHFLKKIKFINAFSLVGISSALGFGFFNIRLGNQATGSAEIALSFLAIINLLYLRYSLNYKTAGRNILFLMYCVLLFLLLFGGVEHTGIFWYYTFPLLAFFLQGKKSGFFYTGLLYLLTALFYLLHDAGYIPLFAYTFIEIRQLFASLFAVTLLVYFYEKIREETEKELQLQEKDIWLKNIFDQQFVDAATIQKSFIPQTINSNFIDIVGYYKPAMEIGGDYFDFFPLDDERTGIIICDVSGKGIPAALIMAKIRTVIKTLPNINQLKPEDLLETLNCFLVNESMDSIFITALYMIVNRKTHTVEFSNAGHFPLTYFSKNKMISHEETTQGMPIGITVKENQYFNYQLNVEKGDILVLFTDGFTDMTQKCKNCISWEKVENLIIQNNELSASEISEKLIAEIKNNTDDRNQSDDISLIVVKIKQ